MASVLHPTEKPEGPAESPPEFDEATRERIEIVAEEKKKALEEPGPSWRDWLYYEAFKWWLAIALLVVDSWVVAQWLELSATVGVNLAVVGAVLSILGAIYVEFLLYRYLWYRPHPDAPRLRRGQFRRSWMRPVEYGRWTPEAKRVREGLAAEPNATDIDANEFL